MTPPAARLGILMLDTQFPRVPGDVGNPDTWPFPVRYSVVQGATPDAVVRQSPEPLVREFVKAGRALIAQGCTGIATTCGFLTLIRPRLTHELGVPVAASSLEQAQQIRATLAPDRRLGILTISAESLSPAHLEQAGVPSDSEVEGVAHTSFGQTILQNRKSLHVDAARRDLTDAACALARRAPDLGALLLECTNMVPYAPDIARATGLPVYSIYTYLTWFHGSLRPAAFPAP